MKKKNNVHHTNTDEAEKTNMKKTNIDTGDTPKANTEKIITDKTNFERINTKKANTERIVIGKTSTEKTDTGKTDTGKTNTGRTNTEKTITGRINTEKTNTGRTNTEKKITGRTNTEERKTEKTNTGRTNTERTNTGRTNTERTNTGRTNTERTNTERTNTERTNTEETNTGRTNTGKSNVEKANTNKTYTETVNVEKADAQENHTDTPRGAMGKEPRKKKKRHLGLWLGFALLAVLLLVFFIPALYFQSHFLPNMSINDMDCSYLTVQEAAELLQKGSRDYRLRVEDRDGNEVGLVAAEDIDLALTNTEEALRTLLEGQNVLTWVTALGEKSNSTLAYSVIFDEEKVEKLLMSWDALAQTGVKEPEDAYISDYSLELGKYEIIPEKEGNRLDIARVKEAVAEAIRAGQDKVNLEAQDCYIKAEITADDADLQQKLETLNRWVSADIVYDWNGARVELDGTAIRQWIREENGSYTLDEEAAAQFVADNARANDTYGKKRRFVTALGEELTLPSGAFGWKTDRKQETAELLELIEKGSVTEREPVYSSRGAQKGADDIGSSYVECDLSNQHLYLYQDGSLVLETDFVSGNMSKSGRMTPPGVFGLTYKTRNAVLRGEDYETPVKYWMPFNGNVGMHDASWRSSFGGDIFLTGGSHGCVNLPPAMAAQIYEYVSTGFPVICYYY